MRLKLISLLLFLSFAAIVRANYILIPMDLKQKQHLKAYGICYWVLEQNVEAWWLLNYRGGSFAFPYAQSFEKECL
ncbi:MAG TPA: asparagine synthetase B, partial [Saprospiraceae bacterium]|nr:asparagine synthetase B [Saprospiraceae bacterium]